MKKYLYLCIMVYVLNGCATSYSPGLSRGYSEIQLDSNSFQVSFSGNGKTSDERASDFCLLRCAELSLSNDFQYFSIVDEKDLGTTMESTSPIVTQSNVKITGNDVKGSSFTYGGDTKKIKKPTVRYKIICYKDRPLSTSYNAKIVSSSIKKKYSID